MLKSCFNIKKSFPPKKQTATRKFYLINVSKEASQMYTLTAKTKDVREEWVQLN